MNSRAQLWQRLIAATIVAAGIAVVWGVAVGWVVSLAESVTRRATIREQLAIAYDGTPVILVQSDDQSGTSELDRRTLDGKPWPKDYELWLSAAYPRRFELPPGVVQFPIRWNEYGARVGGASDGKKPPTSWYVVSADEQAAYLYFAGYDPRSKLPVGYIGTKGFRVSPPPLEEQFACTANLPGRVTDRVGSSQYFEPYSIVRYHDLSAYDRPAQWLVFLVDGKRFWEIDLRERTSRVVMEVPDSLSLDLLRTLESTVQTAKPDDSARHRRPAPFRFAALQYDVFRALPQAAATDPDAEPPKTRGIVAIRTRDRVLLYDATSRNHWKFTLPGVVVPDTAMSLYWLDTDTVLLNCYGGWSGGDVNHLYWISSEGEIEREEHVELQGYVQPPESQKFWGMCAQMPEPLGWLGMLLGVDPFWRVQYYKANTYAAALEQTFKIGWPMALVVLVLSLAAAWYAKRLHQRYFRPRPGVWTTFVFACGLPGLIAYWLEHRRAKLEPCSECGATVPRDRDACAVCATPFAAPPPVGTEIFA
jgi:hypothetical protein